ncbi:MAG: peptidylprolyl isomerase [Bacteroidales bacterium]|nr:peptidylprolyl isomerase [Bacteroidales bacterium]
MRKLAICILSMSILAFNASLSAQNKSEEAKKTDKKEVIVLMRTTAGDMKIKLFNETPLHRDNFVKLVKEHYYDGLLFHRVIKNFMIQGGDPDSRNAQPNAMLGSGGPNYTIPAEFVSSLYHVKGALAAARTMNPQKASSGSQFYIVDGNKYTDEQLNAMDARRATPMTKEQRDAYKTVGGTPFLDGEYTVYGQVIEGLDVIDKIASVTTGSQDRPVEDVRIISVEIVEK